MWKASILISKCSLALREFKRSAADIVLVQETHLDKSGNMAFSLKNFPQMYLASNPRQPAGWAILFKQGSLFQLQPLYTDNLGHDLIHWGTWKGSDLTLCNIYATRIVNQISFLSKEYKRLFAAPHQYLVSGGYFGLSFSPRLDRHTMGRGRSSSALDWHLSYFAN